MAFEWDALSDEESGQLDAVVGGTGAPWWRVTGERLPMPVVVRFGTTDNGRLACTGLVLSDQPAGEVSARMLREVPLSELGNDLLRERDRWAAMGELGRFLADEAVGVVAPAHPGPKGHPPEHFEHVAAAYRRALVEAPRRPVQVLCEQYGASEATVRRWLQRARDMGLLGEARPGRAGEKKKRQR